MEVLSASHFHLFVAGALRASRARHCECRASFDVMIRLLLSVSVGDSVLASSRTLDQRVRGSSPVGAQSQSPVITTVAGLLYIVTILDEPKMYAKCIPNSIREFRHARPKTRPYRNGTHWGLMMNRLACSSRRLSASFHRHGGGLEVS